jgi:hypothetical protein
MRRVPLWIFLMLGLALAVGLATGLSPWADGSPDGLEKVAESQGFLAEGRLNAIQDGSPVPDYAFPGIGNERLATAVAGFVGTIGVFLLGTAVVWLVRRGRPERSGGDGTAATA